MQRYDFLIYCINYILVLFSYFVTYYDKLVFNYVIFHRSLLKIAFGEVTWLNIKLTNTYSRQSTSLQPYAPYVFLFYFFILRRKCAMQASWKENTECPTCDIYFDTQIVQGKLQLKLYWSIRHWKKV